MLVQEYEVSVQFGDFETGSSSQCVMGPEVLGKPLELSLYTVNHTTHNLGTYPKKTHNLVVLVYIQSRMQMKSNSNLVYNSALNEQ